MKSQFYAIMISPGSVKNIKVGTTNGGNFVSIAAGWDSPPHHTHTFVDIFSGAGGLSLGLSQSGLTGVAGVEFWDHAAETYRKNQHHPCVEGDITHQSTKDELTNAIAGRQVDVLAGGFPCQGFSLAGLRDLADPRNQLYRELLTLAKALSPKVLVFENVKGILSMDKGQVITKIVDDFRDIGYILNYKLLKASHYDTPQSRERVIFIGSCDGNNLFPEPFTENVPCGRVFTKPIPKSDPNHVFTKHTADMVRRLADVKQGASLYPTFSDSWRRLDPNKPSPTVKENHGGVFIHPLWPRNVTPREMARLQGFPDNYIFSGGKSSMLKQIGNAVPPNLGKAVGLAVLKILSIHHQ